MSDLERRPGAAPGMPKWPARWVERCRPPADSDELRKWIVENIKRDGGRTHRHRELGDDLGMERRSVAAPAAASTSPAVEREQGEATSVGGVVCPFGCIADIGAFTEEYASMAFNAQARRGWRNSFDLGVLGLWAHDHKQPLASLAGGTLKLEVTARGVAYRMWPVLAGVGAYAMKLVNRGDVTGSSAGFRIVEDLWTVKDGEMPHRAILEAELFEASLTPWPSYPAATAEPRHATTATEASRRLAEMDLKMKRDEMRWRLRAIDARTGVLEGYARREWVRRKAELDRKRGRR